MKQKKRLFVQRILLILAITLFSGMILFSAAALPEIKSEKTETQYSITVNFYGEESGVPEHVEMIVGVSAGTPIFEAVQAELGDNWINLYRGDYRQNGRLGNELNLSDEVTENIVIEIFYPLAEVVFSAMRMESVTSSATRP